MTHLYVRVRLHGALVEQRLLPLTDGMRLGEAADAVVSFPGADLLVQVVDDRLRVRGRDLGPGDLLTMELGPVQVAIEVLSSASRWDRLARLANAPNLMGDPTSFRGRLPAGPRKAPVALRKASLHAQAADPRGSLVGRVGAAFLRSEPQTCQVI